MTFDPPGRGTGSECIDQVSDDMDERVRFLQSCADLHCYALHSETAAYERRDFVRTLRLAPHGAWRSLRTSH